MSRLNKQLTVTVAGLRGPGLTGGDIADLQGYVENAQLAEAGANESAEQAQDIAATLDGMLGQLPGSNAFEVEDEAGNLLLQVTPTEVNHPDINAIRSQALASVPAGQAVSRKIATPAVALADEGENLLLEFSPRWVASVTDAIAKAGAAYAATLGTPKPSLRAQINSIDSYGQSNGDGRGAAISTTPLTYVDMLGTNPRGTGGTTSLSGYMEVGFESPLYGCLQMIQQLATADGLNLAAADQRFFGSISAEGGQSSLQLSKGGTYFDRIGTRLGQAKALYDATGKSFAVGAQLYTQGEADYGLDGSGAGYKVTSGRRGYASVTRKIFSDIQAEALARTGTNAMVPFITWQVSTHLYYGKSTPTIALAQLDMATDANVCMATPSWFLTFGADNLHVIATSSEILGAYYGQALYNWLIKGTAKQMPFMPIEAAAVGKAAMLVFDPAGPPPVLDNSFGAAMYGLTITDANGVDIPVTAVSKVGKNVIRVATNSALTPGCKVRHAWTGNGFKGVGGIRDNSGAALAFEPAGINWPMHRYAPIFELTLI